MAFFYGEGKRTDTEGLRPEWRQTAKEWRKACTGQGYPPSSGQSAPEKGMLPYFFNSTASLYPSMQGLSPLRFPSMGGSLCEKCARGRKRHWSERKEMNDDFRSD
ncbi:MAG: hypothetical protein C4530_13680 [Desulfobacteraceae bacterium]|nr:MAG: hypothetical protein C4530_13680 [Desulfobacteraceae bacterium]